MPRSQASLDRRAEYNQRWWRENGAAYNRAHPRRAARVPLVSRTQVLAEDLEQQRQLARLSRRRGDGVESYAKRERAWIFQSSLSVVTYDEHLDGQGVQL